MRRILLCAVALTLVGCATKPRMTRQEALQVTTRTYTGVTQEQVISAAERVLTLADGDDFTFAHRTDGFLANRLWSVYLVLAASVGNDIWVLSATPRPDGSVFATVEVGTSASAITPMTTTTPGTWTATSLPPSAVPITGPALYEIFWGRVEYLLGFSDSWVDCKTADERVKSKATWGDNSALCNSFNMKDKKPEGPMLAQQAARAAALPAAPSPVVAPVPAPPQPVAVTTPPPAATSSVAAVPAGYVSKFSYQAFGLPEVRACNPNPDVSLVAAGSGTETYAARCANGGALMVTCEWGNCRVLR